MDCSLRARFTLFGQDLLGQPFFHEPVERPIDERATHREDTAYLAARSQLSGESEPVGRSLSEEAEDCVLGHGELCHVQIVICPLMDSV
jgi:hypothetical protein